MDEDGNGGPGAPAFLEASIALAARWLIKTLYACSQRTLGASCRRQCHRSPDKVRVVMYLWLSRPVAARPDSFIGLRASGERAPVIATLHRGRRHGLNRAQRTRPRSQNARIVLARRVDPPLLPTVTSALGARHIEIGGRHGGRRRASLPSSLHSLQPPRAADPDAASRANPAAGRSLVPVRRVERGGSTTSPIGLID